MKAADYVVDELIKYGVTDAFGIPGGVILKFLRAMNSRKSELEAHLCYHEQAAGFAAIGYSVAKGSLGLAYATRGPGITNMITCIAEAYQESSPVLFITAHSQSVNQSENNVIRVCANQELDIVHMVKNITVFSAQINDISEIKDKLTKAVNSAKSGRKGPVLLDFNASLWDREMPEDDKTSDKEQLLESGCDISDIVCMVSSEIEKAERPVILIGDGLRFIQGDMFSLFTKLGIPVLSSRGSQDIIAGHPLYYGYVGSHANRYSNFIISKADLIISFGNRMAFPFSSDSFAPVINNAKVIRIDIDAREFVREIDGAINICADAQTIMDAYKLGMLDKYFDALQGRFAAWISVCSEIKSRLIDCDITEPVKKLIDYINSAGDDRTYVCDVGNNEFWFSRAYARSIKSNKVLCSKSFGTLGSAVGKAIGAYYAERKSVTLITGDQGLQMNIQELQYIASHKLPITIIVINNMCSGMIADHEAAVLKGERIHVDSASDYYAPDFRGLSEAYGIKYYLNDFSEKSFEEPLLYEIVINKDISLTPNLPKGNPCYQLIPELDSDLVKYLNDL